MGVGEYTADSLGMFAVSSCGRLGFVSLLGLSLSPAEPSLLSELDFFSSFNRLSNPSTRFNKASNTSVFGPRFFGTASKTIETRQYKEAKN